MSKNAEEFAPPVVGEAGPQPDERLCRRLTEVSGAASEVSDALDALGIAAAVPADALAPLLPGRRVAGRALTVRYLPERRRDGAPRRLAHAFLFSLARPGDVLVMEADLGGRWSTFGGVAAQGAIAAGIGGTIVDGAVRDVDEIRAAGIAVWARSITPISGARRVEAVAVNTPIRCGGVQVRPGDVVVADDSGVCFVPAEVFGDVCRRVLKA